MTDADSELPARPPARNEKLESLRAFLDSLAPAKALELARMVERELVSKTAADEMQLFILDSLRPILRESRPARRPTPLRIFVEPFEDLLITDEPAEKLAGRISRRSIDPVWRLLKEELIPEFMSKISKAIIDASLVDDPDELDAATEDLHFQAATALKKHLHDCDQDPDQARELRLKFNRATRVDDMREMVFLLEIASEVRKMQAALPKPAEDLTGPTLGIVRGIVDDVSRLMPMHGGYLAMAVMGRLTKPWQAIRVGGVSMARDDSPLYNSQFKLVGEALVRDIEEEALRLRRTRLPGVKGGPSLAHAALENFAVLVKGLLREVKLNEKGPWGTRVKQARNAVKEDVFPALLDPAQNAIYAALPAYAEARGADGMGRQTFVPKPGYFPDRAKIDLAEWGCQVLVGMGDVIDFLQLRPNLDAAIEQVASTMEAQCITLGEEHEKAPHEELATHIQHLGRLLMQFGRAAPVRIQHEGEDDQFLADLGLI